MKDSSTAVFKHGSVGEDSGWWELENYITQQQ